MKFSIIGNGNIAWYLGKRLSALGHDCVGIYGRNINAVKELADALKAKHYGAIGDIKDGAADVCFLEVSDAAIAEVSKKLSFKETVLVHTAGAVPLDVIKNAAADRAIMWPVYSISRKQLPQHRNIPCAWEANTGKAKRIVLKVGNAITDMLFETEYEQRKWLHLTAVIGNNFVNHLLAICEEICKDNQLRFEVLEPIISQTFDRIKQARPRELQTGPAVRKDENTIQQQIALLNGHPEWQKIYEAITASIQKNR